MSDAWGQPPWRVEVDVPAATLPEGASVVVVGAGLTGLSAAYHVRRARPSWTVAVLDAGAVGSGASGRSGGLLLDATAAGPDPRFEGCLSDAAALIEREGIECGLELGGCWEVVHGVDAPGSPLLWEDAGRPLRVARQIPGGVVDPGRLVAGMARAALARGATICEGCDVLSLRAGERPALATSRGDVAADWVVLATNAYALGMSGLPRRAMPYLTLAVATAPLSEVTLDRLGLASRRPFHTVDQPSLWGRVTARGELVLGSGLLMPERGDVRRSSLASTSGAAMLASIERRARLLHPELAEVPIVHRWGGPILIPEDFRPVLEEHPTSPRVLVAGGYTGHGLAQSLRMGELVAARVGGP